MIPALRANGVNEPMVVYKNGFKCDKETALKDIGFYGSLANQNREETNKLSTSVISLKLKEQDRKLSSLATKEELKAQDARIQNIATNVATLATTMNDLATKQDVANLANEFKEIRKLLEGILRPYARSAPMKITPSKYSDLHVDSTEDKFYSPSELSSTASSPETTSTQSGNSSPVSPRDLRKLENSVLEEDILD